MFVEFPVKLPSPAPLSVNVHAVIFADPIAPVEPSVVIEAVKVDEPLAKDRSYVMGFDSETPLTPMSATASSPRFFAFMCSQSKMASGAGYWFARSGMCCMIRAASINHYPFSGLREWDLGARRRSVKKSRPLPSARRVRDGIVRSGFCPKRYVTGALCALLLLSGSSWPTSAADAKPLRAILLIAGDDLPDSNFADSVVLVMNNLAPAPVGIIINRPMPIPVSRLFPDLKRLAQVRDKLYFGGPVEFASVWFLFRATTPPEHAIQACDGVYLSADRKLLLQLLGRDKPMDGLRIFLGHAGWASGQLEAEIANGDWTLKRAEPEAIFNGKSEHPWPMPQAPKRST